MGAMQGRSFDFAVLALGICAVSTAAVLIREADAPAMAIAAYRLSLASLPLLLYAGARRRVVINGRRNLLLSLLAGVFLALHFGLWIASVQETSVVTSVTLVASQPLYVGLASGPILGEPPSRAIWLAVGIALLGTLIMVAQDVGAGGDSLQGDLFAVLGAVCASAYVLTGRAVRTSGAGWGAYITVAYAVAAVLLVLALAVSGDAFFGYSRDTYAYFILLALVPQLIGHTAVNRSLGYLPAVTISIAILGEPVGATLLAAAVLGETPTALQLIGGLVLLGGIYAGIRASISPRNTIPLPE